MTVQTSKGQILKEGLTGEARDRAFRDFFDHMGRTAQRIEGVSEEEIDAAKGLPYVSWAFVLRPLDAHNTRLIVRFRADYRADWSGSFAETLVPVNFFMERSALYEIRQRAESTVQLN